MSVVIPIRNEAHHLASCLAALRRFQEVIVVDSRSTDGSRNVAAKFGVPVLEFDWSGGYPKKRNWVLLTQDISCGWVLFLDADEVVNDEFCDEVARAVGSGDRDGFWLNYTNYFLGYRLRYGVAQRKLALFKKGAGLYEEIDEKNWSGLDMEVHEHPIIAGPVGEIATRIDHRDFSGLEKFISRHLEYARWEARRHLALNHSASKTAGGRFTGRQRFKYKNMASWWYPIAYWGFSYFVKGGFLDGRAGFQYAFYKAWYFNTIRLMIAELAEDKPRA